MNVVRSSSVVGVAFCLLVLSSCSSGSESSSVTSSGGEPLCDGRAATVVDSFDDTPDESGLFVEVVDSDAEWGEEVGLQVAEALEQLRIGQDISAFVTEFGATEVDEAGFTLGTDASCLTQITVDSDVGAISASLRFVEVRVVVPECDAVRFRVVLRDSRWQLDDVLLPTPEGLTEICGDSEDSA